MAKNRDPRRGFLARWFHRLRWLRRALFIAGLVGGVVQAVQRRSGGGSTGGSGAAGGGPGGSGRPAPVGGPTGPRLAASKTAPVSGDADLDTSSEPAAVRTLVSVPPLDDKADERTAAAADVETGVVVPLTESGIGDEPDESDDGPGGSTAPVLTIVGDAETDAPGAGGSWAPPLDNGECPPGYPVKANANSGIYHVPGGRSYNRTVAERCYASAEAAEADGYRPAKA